MSTSEDYTNNVGMGIIKNITKYDWKREESLQITIKFEY